MQQAMTWSNINPELWCHMASLGPNELKHLKGFSRADSRFAPSQWEMSLQSNAISHWLGASLESALYTDMKPLNSLWPSEAIWWHIFGFRYRLVTWWHQAFTWTDLAKYHLWELLPFSWEQFHRNGCGNYKGCNDSPVHRDASIFCHYDSYRYGKPSVSRFTGNYIHRYSWTRLIESWNT